MEGGREGSALSDSRSHYAAHAATQEQQLLPHVEEDEEVAVEEEEEVAVEKEQEEEVL